MSDRDTVGPPEHRLPISVRNRRTSMSILDSDEVLSQKCHRSESSWEKCALQGSMRFCVEAIVVTENCVGEVIVATATTRMNFYSTCFKNLFVGGRNGRLSRNSYSYAQFSVFACFPANSETLIHLLQNFWKRMRFSHCLPSGEFRNSCRFTLCALKHIQIRIHILICFFYI